MNNNNPNNNKVPNEPGTHIIKSEFPKPELLKTNQKMALILSKGTKLNSFTQRNLDTKHINFSIFHLLLDPFTLDNSYKNLSKNKGSLTQGISGYTADSYSRRDSLTTINQLKNKTYSATPVKRVFVPKPLKIGLRPLGIPIFKDRVIQEAMRAILEAVWEPEFQEFETRTFKCTNYGFRPRLNCWDAVENFTKHSQKATFVIQGDIVGAYNNVNHQKLLELVSRRIKDKNFINLLNQFLKAGIMQEGRFEHSILGVPQGGILSPILFNIYMFEFDKFVYYDIIKKYETLALATKNKTSEYQKALYKKNKLRKEYRNTLLEFKEIKTLKEKHEMKKTLDLSRKSFLDSQNTLFKTPSYDRREEIRIAFVRYADDWILSIAGNYPLAVELKNKIAEWLTLNLKLTLSPEKTGITNIRKDFIYFLGYKITLRSKYRFTKIATFLRFNSKTNKHEQITTRTTSSKFYIQPNDTKLLAKVKAIGLVRNSDLFPIGKRAWSCLDEFQIVQKYHSIFLGLVQHYSKCDSFFPLNRISYIFQYSCAKTIATRKRITLSQTFKTYGKNLKIVRPYLDDPDKIRTIEFLTLKDIKEKYLSKGAPKPLSPQYDPFKIRTFWRTTFKMYSICCICGCDENIQMHHIKSLKSIDMSIKNKKAFNLILMQLNRKQVPVCPECHKKITDGRYDHINIRDLFSKHLASL